MLFKAYNLVIDSDFDLRLPTAISLPADSYFRHSTIKNIRGWKTNIYRRNIQAKVSLTDTKIGLNWPGIANFEAHNAQFLHYQQFTKDDDIFRLFATSEALGLILHQKGIFLLHGSAVKIGNKAYVFIGIPGAGKSTTIAAFAKTGHTVLSDDMTAISFDEDGKAVVIPAFPQIKIWEDSVINLGFDKTMLEPAYEGHNKYLLKQNEDTFPTTAIPLQRIIILQKPYSRLAGAVNPIEAPIELLKYFPLPQQILRADSLKKHFEDSLKIAAQISFSRINRPKNYSELFKFINTFQ